MRLRKIGGELLRGYRFRFRNDMLQGPGLEVAGSCQLRLCGVLKLLVCKVRCNRVKDVKILT